MQRKSCIQSPVHIPCISTEITGSAKHGKSYSNSIEESSGKTPILSELLKILDIKGLGRDMGMCLSVVRAG